MSVPGSSGRRETPPRAPSWSADATICFRRTCSSASYSSCAGVLSYGVAFSPARSGKSMARSTEKTSSLRWFRSSHSNVAMIAFDTRQLPGTRLLRRMNRFRNVSPQFAGA